jgi:hypothetical protein
MAETQARLAKSSADGKQRTIFLFGGIGTAVATLENWDNPNRSFTYRNVSAGLLPVANSHTTVSVIEDAKGSALKMTATYDFPLDASAEVALAATFEAAKAAGTWSLRPKGGGAELVGGSFTVSKK